MAPRVLIFGTGCIGTVYAYVLSRSIPSSNIVTICRSNYDAATKDGFTIHSPAWGRNQTVRPVVVRSAAEAAALDPSTPFDFVLVCCKALPGSLSPAELIKPAISPSTTIVLIQNGISIEKPYAEAFPDNTLLSTVVYLPSTQIEPGVVLQYEGDLLHIGSYPASSDTTVATRFSELLANGGATTKVHEDVQVERWAKLVSNASCNPICALSRSRDVQFLNSTPDASEVLKDVMSEVAQVATACGYPSIDSTLVSRQHRRVVSRSLPGTQPSMMADALDGKGMEVETIVGSVIKLGKEHAVQLPMLRTIYVLLGALDDSFRREHEMKAQNRAMITIYETIDRV